MSLVSHTALKAAKYTGLVPESVADQVWQLMEYPLPFTDAVGSESHGNEFTSWLVDTLAAPDLTNAVVDGAAAGSDNNALPRREGNHSQIADKVVSASNRARDGDTIAMGDPFTYQFQRRLKELKRDIEAIVLSNQASIADAGAGTPGKCGGLDAWLKTNTSNGNTGANGGFVDTTGLVGVATPGTKRALSETIIRDIAQGVYEQGGDPTMLMGTPSVIRALSAYMFTSTAQVATLSSDVKQERGSVVATGSVNVFVTDFGAVMSMIANRVQQPTDTATSSLFVLDPSKLAISYIARPNMVPLAKLGLSDSGQLYADFTLKVYGEEQQGVIRAIDEAAAVVA